MSLGPAAHPSTPCGFVPPYLLEHIAATTAPDSPAAPGQMAPDPEAARCAEQTLRLDELLREQRLETGPGPGASEAAPESAAPDAQGAAWQVYTAGNTTRLPGEVRRAEGEPATGDPAVDEAAVGGSGALALFAEIYGRNSYDDAGATVVMTVHYGRQYNNAFWNGRQLVFGDGDGRIFDRFTKPVDVLGHELTHAVTEHTAGLVYRDQPGALNESMSDVFASCAKQRMLGQSVTDADWLIGAGLFLPDVQARALRDMAAPGTAYDDPRLGRDPQVGHMDDYIHTTDDNGGVHLNSGIPNRAFHLAALGIGGTAWDGAGAIWYAALTGPDVSATTSFVGFAEATLTAAGSHVDVVREAWVAVGVLGATGAAASAAAPSREVEPEMLVRVRRSGGFAGLTTEGSVDLRGDDPRVVEVRQLTAQVTRIDVPAGGAGESHPDEYVYAFRLPGAPALAVPEHLLTDDLRRLADLLLP